MKKIALIGSTGSIGVQTLNVVRRYPDKFNIVSLSAGNNTRLFCEQVKEFRPKVATSICEMEEKLSGVKYFHGEDSFTNAIIDEADIVVVALVGFKGILAVIDAINKGKDVALANKESLVVGGEIVTDLAKEKGVKIVPIDSEHSAIWQALDFDFNKPFKRIILTASGGAFRDLSPKETINLTAKDALKHPNWAMGAKITVDCATMVNKAFEVAEAKWLYNTDISNIDVIIHRESIIHSMVEFNDGSTIAQMSYPTMELPIQLALSYPERFNLGLKSLDFASIGKLSFEPLSHEKYPCFSVVIDAVKKGGVYPALVNGANDMAVELFLKDKIGYGDIYKALSHVVNTYNENISSDIKGLIFANNYARKSVREIFGV